LSFIPLFIVRSDFSFSSEIPPSVVYVINNFTCRVSQTEVPEPSAIALLGLGLIGIGLARRRRQAL
jgi:hypothetical protein